MISLRLKTIASLVDKDSKVIDIGTDHAYLPIYLYNNDITHNITASDISNKVLESSLKNLKKYDLEREIPLILSDGFKNIENEFDTAVIAGMGTITIIDILENAKKLPNTLIIEPQNDYYILRSYLNKIGYRIDKEIVIFEKGIYYVIIKYIKGFETLNKKELLFGKSNNYEYLKYLMTLYDDLYKKSNKKDYFEYIKMLKEMLDKK